MLNSGLELVNLNFGELGLLLLSSPQTQTRMCHTNHLFRVENPMSKIRMVALPEKCHRFVCKPCAQECPYHTQSRLPVNVQCPNLPVESISRYESTRLPGAVRRLVMPELAVVL